ncbi:hypothetical protein BDZ91DRAFT_773467 [Kalaharituber pfeilii]|nr:hypothetical protein BDZ91DRAFT_773467 [Kalaharituber pfeilii]
MSRAEDLKKIIRESKKVTETQEAILSTREKNIILRSSKIGGRTFPPWESDPLVADFKSLEPFSDANGMLPLSEAQLKILDSWKRPSEIHVPPKHIITIPESPVDLAQDAITDCSIVASLCAAISREERDHPKIVSNIIFPQDAHGNPMVSTNGKYVVKLYFNGCYRKVVIDDYLPVSNTGRALHVVCRANLTLMWPALVEKAYLKIMGGYDFPGSNSGTDLLALTGWIPEHVFLQSDDVVPAALWKRIHKAWGFGDVLITLGTGVMASYEEDELGLASEHDYAVLDLREIDGRRLVLVKNPWSDGAVWKGGLDHLDSDSEGEGEDDDDKEPEEWTEWDESMALPTPGGPGQFWIDLNQICRHFANMYLNWNPALFFFRYDHHFTWDLQKDGGTRCKASFVGHPQYTVHNPSETKSATVWLLLQRHIHGQQVEMGGPKAGYISLYLFDNGGRKTFLSDGALIRGPYVDSPQTLLRLDALPPKTAYTVVVSSQDLALEQHAFTLSVFSDYPLKMAPAADLFPFQRTISYAWVPENAGGNAQSPMYSINPQFKLTLKPAATATDRADLTLLLESRDELSVHVKVVWGGGKRIATVTSRDIIAESGEYRRGCALAEVRGIQCPGVYTVVASTFEKGQVGDFVLRVMGSVEFEIEPIRAESSLQGKLSKIIEGNWPITTADGERCICLIFPIYTPRLTRLSLVARNATSSLTTADIITSPKPLLRLSFQRQMTTEYISRRENAYLALTRRPEVLAGSGPEFSDVPQGVRTGDYFGVLERMGGSEGEGYEIVVLADGEVVVGEEVGVGGGQGGWWVREL